MLDQYTHKKGIVYKNQFHVIFCPKYRRKVLVGDVEQDLRDLLFRTAEHQDVTIKELEIMPDHVHMFIEFDPRRNIHKIIKDFKGISAHELREKYPHLKRMPSLWTRSYFSCSVGHISEKTVMQYIQTQKTRG